MWDLDWPGRRSFERRLVKKCFPDSSFSEIGTPCFTCLVGGGGRINNYKQRLDLSYGFPDRGPDLYIEYPRILPMRDGRTINSLGTSSQYHVFDNGPQGEVKICYGLDWNASFTCIMPLIRGVIWIDGYENHLRTGETIASFIDRFRKKLEAASQNRSGIIQMPFTETNLHRFADTLRIQPHNLIQQIAY